MKQKQHLSKVMLMTLDLDPRNIFFVFFKLHLGPSGGKHMKPRAV